MQPKAILYWEGKFGQWYNWRFYNSGESFKKSFQERIDTIRLVSKVFYVEWF